MEEILEELLTHAQPDNYGAYQATEEQLLEAQEQIFLSPPSHYREFLLKASHLVIGTLEPASIFDTNIRSYLPELCAQAWDEGLPRQMIAACEHPAGYYCVADDDTVLDWRDGDFDEHQWETIWEWAREVWLRS